MIKIAVIGLGKAGLPLVCMIADHGFDIIGIDIDKKRCSIINNGINPISEEKDLDELIRKYGGKNIMATSGYDDAKGCNFFIVITPLFIDENHEPDFTILENSFRSVGKILKHGDCVVLETTVPPGTTDTLVKKWLEDESHLNLGNFYLAHSPERIMTGFSISRLKHIPKIIGGVDKESGKIAFNAYKNFIPNMQLVSSAKMAEFVKVIEGCYRDVNIALANELFKIAHDLDVDFYEAREYSSHQCCDIHLPSTGVGGHCIPFYPWFLIKEMEKRNKYDYCVLLKNSRETNDQMINYWADKIILKCLDIDKPLKYIKICIKGITYRKGVKELINSTNLRLAKLLAEKGLNVYAYDDLLSKDEIEKIGIKFIEYNDADIIFDCFDMKFLTKSE